MRGDSFRDSDVLVIQDQTQITESNKQRELSDTATNTKLVRVWVARTEEKQPEWK